MGERRVHHAERRVNVPCLRLRQQRHLLVIGEDEVTTVLDADVRPEEAFRDVAIVDREFQVGRLLRPLLSPHTVSHASLTNIRSTHHALVPTDYCNVYI